LAAREDATAKEDVLLRKARRDKAWPSQLLGI